MIIWHMLAGYAKVSERPASYPSQTEEFVMRKLIVAGVLSPSRRHSPRRKMPATDLVLAHAPATRITWACMHRS